MHSEAPYLLLGLKSYIMEQRADINGLLFKNYIEKIGEKPWLYKDLPYDRDQTMALGSVLEKGEEEMIDVPAKTFSVSDMTSVKNSIQEIPDDVHNI